MRFYAVPAFAFTFVYLCLGLFYFILYSKSRPREPDQIVFAILTVTLAGYSFCCFGLYLAEDPIEGRPWQVAQWVFLFPGVALLVHFFWAHLRVPRARWVAVAYAVAALFVVLDLTTPLFFTYEPLVKRFEIGGMEVTYNEVENGPAGLAFYAFLGWSLGWIFIRLVRAPVELRRHLRPVRLGLTVFSGSIANDVLVTEGVYEFVYLVEYGYLAFAIGMAAILLGRYAALNHRLGRAVEERTREIHRLNETLAQSERLAAIGTLAATLSREVSRPLSEILRSLDALDRKLSSATGKELMESIRDEVERVSRVSHGLVTLARTRPDSGESIDVNALVEDFLKLYRLRLAAGKIDVETALDPACRQVLGRAWLFHQVLLNLVKNAEEAMPSGGRIRIRTEPTPRGVRVEIRDTGPGLDPKILTRLFEPFFTTKGAKGNGLGLFVAQGIVESMGGKIEAENAPVAGALFRIHLPIAADLRGPEPGRP